MLSTLLVLSAVPWAVEGHGYMTNPAIRGIATPPAKYEPQSVGAVGPGGEITLCGKGKAANHIPGTDQIVKMPTPGSQYTFEAKITAHHKGHMIVRVCPFLTGSSTYSDLSNCIRLKDPEGDDTWALSTGTGMKQWVATLPSKAELEALNSPKGVFSIQWRWNTANSCNPSNALGNSNCGEQKCCSEVFTNCADVVFDGIDSSPPDDPVDPPAPRPSPSPPPPGSQPSGGGAGKCVAGGAWAGDEATDAWCATEQAAGNIKCGGDGGATCDCTCSGGADAEPEPESESEPEVGHVVTAKAAAAGVLKGLSAFCQANKAYLCDPTGTDEYLGNLCECNPASTGGSTPEPEPEAEPQAEPEADTDSETDSGTNFPDSWSCKQKCQKTCVDKSGGVQTNQEWGKPDPYIKCVCSDASEHTFPGCECKHANCPKVVLASTKFAGGVRQQVEVQAHGDLDMH